MQNKAAAGSSKLISGAGQSWAAPTSLAQLMDALRAPTKDGSQQAPRIIAGNTGSGEVLTCISNFF